MEASTDAHFKQNYQAHLQHLKLKGLQPKTIEAYSRAIRRMGDYFDHQLDNLSEGQLMDYFTELVTSHSWSSVKLDLYGLKFYYAHVLRKPWVAPGLIKPPRTMRLADVVTLDEVQRIFAATRVVSYRVFFFTLYIVWGCAWAKGCDSRWGISMRRVGACISAMPRATEIVSFPCRKRHTRSCNASGKCIATPCCCFPIVTVV